ncbi:MAG: hypothetical protein B6I24_04575 [Bacteroidetes bacterium 4572_128]|nr:MAG: hypothetical protein B6I24_04575 [Bacteroidetes bacterium 4572_128]
MIRKEFFIILILISLLNNNFSYSQLKFNKVELSGQQNVISSAVPFLMIAPDSRSGAMGDVGAATKPDANSLHWNPAKYAFIKRDFGVSISYTPWLKALVDDIGLSYLSLYKRIDDKQTFALSLLYFSLGSITFTDINGSTLRDYEPKELSVDLAYARKLGERISGGLAGRYIYSNLTGGIGSSGSDTKPGNAIAMDVSTYYENSDLSIGKTDLTWAWGVVISNIGNKISYSEEESSFLPANLRLGTAFTVDIDEFNSISIATDINKLLVPTPAKYEEDEDGVFIIEEGKDNDVSVVSGMMNSFNDAPDGMSEEFRELTYSFGLEYLYNEQFAIRGGYFHEDATKGNRKYYTMGVGIKLSVFSLDFSYLVPTEAHNPLENTLRFSLNFNFEGFPKQEFLE